MKANKAYSHVVSLVDLGYAIKYLFTGSGGGNFFGADPFVEGLLRPRFADTGEGLYFPAYELYMKREEFGLQDFDLDDRQRFLARMH